MKGRPIPNEYQVNKIIPEDTVLLLAARVSNPPRTGPIQGVNPKAKEKPRKIFLI